MTYRYRAYGLNLTSDVPLPGLLAGSGEKTDLDTTMGFAPRWVECRTLLPSSVEHPRDAMRTRDDDAALKLTSYGDGQFFELAYVDGARFVIDGPAVRLWGGSEPPLTRADLLTYLVGPVSGFVLRRRGVTVLHASTVSIGGQAVVLCGPSGSGKSTTAAALGLGGIPVLCEDITPVREIAGQFEIEPGYPRVCLWPDAVEKLLGDARALPQLTPTWEKCFLALDGGRAVFEAEPRTLGAVYLLAPRSGDPGAPTMEELSAREALLELVQNTYMNWLLDRNQRAAEFETLGRLLQQVPVRRIVPHEDPAKINALCELIVADAHETLATKRPASVHADR